MKNMRLAGAGLAEDQQIGAAVDPLLAGSEGQHMGLAQTRSGVEVEVGEGLARRQAGLGAMTLEAPGRAIGHLDLDQGGEQPGRRPSFPVGGLGEALPVPADAGQVEGRQEAWQDGEVGIGAGHGQACAVSRWL